MRIVALLTVRNEVRYLKKSLEHLYNQGVDVCVIDNGSTDKTVEIAENFRKKNVIRIENFPYNGSFELKPILENEERLSKEIDADWFIHHDADEIRQSPFSDKTLKEAIIEVDKQGYNAINFDEFVFLPTQEEPNHEGGDYLKTMQYYYFFEPEKIRRINAWKNFNQKVDIASSGGHRISFDNQKIFPQSFIMRHYIVLSKAHAIAKFCGRVYSEEEVAKNNWHWDRATCKPQNIILPKISELKKLNNSSEILWDKTDVWDKHFFTKLPPISTREKYKAKLKKIKNIFQPKILDINSQQSSKIENLLPVPFVVSVPRSGSTLLRLMLDAHPELSIPPETHFIPDIISLSKTSKDNKKFFYNTIVNHLHWPDFHIFKDDFQKQLDNIETFTYSDGLRAFYTLYMEKFNKKRWGDKTPLYDHHIIDINKLLPEVYFIHIIRDGRDVALSLKDKWFSPGNNIEDLANNWVYRIRETRRQAQHLSNYLEVRFEDLVNEPEKTLQEICDFIKIPFSLQMLEYHKTAENRLAEMENRYNKDGTIRLSKEKRLEIFELTNKPPDKSRIQCWRNEMSEQEIIKFENIAGDLLRDLNY